MGVCRSSTKSGWKAPVEGLVGLGIRIPCLGCWHSSGSAGFVTCLSDE